MQVLYAQASGLGGSSIYDAFSIAACNALMFIPITALAFNRPLPLDLLLNRPHLYRANAQAPDPCLSPARPLPGPCLTPTRPLPDDPCSGRTSTSPLSSFGSPEPSTRRASPTSLSATSPPAR